MAREQNAHRDEEPGPKDLANYCFKNSVTCGMGRNILEVRECPYLQRSRKPDLSELALEAPRAGDETEIR